MPNVRATPPCGEPLRRPAEPGCYLSPGPLKIDKPANGGLRGLFYRTSLVTPLPRNLRLK